MVRWLLGALALLSGGCSSEPCLSGGSGGPRRWPDSVLSRVHFYAWISSKDAALLSHFLAWYGGLGLALELGLPLTRFYG